MDPFDNIIVGAHLPDDDPMATVGGNAQPPALSPAETAELILKDHADQLLVVDRRELYIYRPTVGTWAPMTPRGEVNEGALRDLAGAVSGAGALAFPYTAIGDIRSMLAIATARHRNTASLPSPIRSSIKCLPC